MYVTMYTRQPTEKEREKALKKESLRAVAIIVLIVTLSHCASTDFVSSAFGALKVARVVCTELHSLETHLQSTLDASVLTDSSVDVVSPNE